VEAQPLKPRLLATITAAREREHELMTMADDSPPPEPGLWTIRDHLAHLTWWRVYAAEVLDAVRTGSELPDVADEDDVQNAKIYAANKDRGAEAIKAEARASYDRLKVAIAAISEEDLLKPHPRYPSAASLWQLVPGNGHGHLGQHLMFWHLEQGDEEAAEVAQQWVYDLDRAEFPDPKSVATSTYNMACFYARVGRDDEALHWLKHAFDLNSELKKHAGKDTDLDRIRNHSDFVALIGA
jgi:hypothetical protein